MRDFAERIRREILKPKRTKYIYEIAGFDKKKEEVDVLEKKQGVFKKEWILNLKEV